MADAITNVNELLSLLNLTHKAFDPQHLPQTDFPLRVPKGFIDRMQPGDPNDPLLRQILPTGDENRKDAGDSLDPVGDLLVMPRPGLLHKYHGRALIVATGACAIHCRYCFRRHFPYSDASPTKTGWQDTLAYIEQHSDLSEIILSGGDPLSLSDDRLAAVFQSLTAIPHVQRIRLHTRLPVVIPERVTPSLLKILAQSDQTVMVLHVNHPNEIDTTVATALQRLRDTGTTLLNQAVLLRGINNHQDILKSLSEDLFSCGVLPYYLHMLDPVQGAQHFKVSQQRAEELHTYLRNHLPGYLVPKLVREIAGEPSKTPLS